MNANSMWRNAALFSPKLPVQARAAKGLGGLGAWYDSYLDSVTSAWESTKEYVVGLFGSGASAEALAQFNRGVSVLVAARGKILEIELDSKGQNVPDEMQAAYDQLHASVVSVLRDICPHLKSGSILLPDDVGISPDEFPCVQTTPRGLWYVRVPTTSRNALAGLGAVPLVAVAIVLGVTAVAASVALTSYFSSSVARQKLALVEKNANEVAALYHAAAEGRISFAEAKHAADEIEQSTEASGNAVDKAAPDKSNPFGDIAKYAVVGIIGLVGLLAVMNRVTAPPAPQPRLAGLRRRARGLGATKLPPGVYRADLNTIPYTVARQSRDYLYGWNWTHDATGERGLGYRTKQAALDAAVRHLTTGKG